MDSNTHSVRPSARPSVRPPTGQPGGEPVGPPAGHWGGEPASPPDVLAAAAAVVDRLAGQDLQGLSDVALADQVLELRRLLDRLEGHWLAHLAAVDGRGVAGADQGVPAPSTASWLRNRLHLSVAAAHTSVRTARALFRGPLTQTATALVQGELSPAHAAVLAAGTNDLPHQAAAKAEPALVEAARRLDPPRLRRVLTHLRETIDADAAADHHDRQHQQRRLWLTPTIDGMVAIDGMLEPEAGQLLLAALEPLTRPATAADPRSGSQRRADALTELARRSLEGGQLSQSGGVRPQLAVLVELDSLQRQPGTAGGEVGWAGPLSREACRRLACDSAVTRVLVTRHPTDHHDQHDRSGQEPRGQDGPGGHDHPDGHRGHPPGQHDPHRHHGAHGLDPSGHPGHGPPSRPDPGGPGPTYHPQPDGDPNLTARLQAAMAKLPPTLGGAPTRPLELGRTSRVISPAQRTALAVRDGGCVVPDCQRPLAWCEGHHLVHWLDGGPTDLANLILLCRAHHRAVHDGGWQLTRQPDGRLTASPPDRRPPRRPHRVA